MLSCSYSPRLHAQACLVLKVSTFCLWARTAQLEIIVKWRRGFWLLAGGSRQPLAGHPLVQNLARYVVHENERIADVLTAHVVFLASASPCMYGEELARWFRSSPSAISKLFAGTQPAALSHLSTAIRDVESEPISIWPNFSCAICLLLSNWSCSTCLEFEKSQ